MNEDINKKTLEAKAKYEGMHFFTRDREKEFIIKNYNSAADITIEFIESGYTKKVNLGNINKGLPNPFANSPHVAFEDPAKALNGSYFHTNDGGIIRIVDASSYSHVKYQFQDEFGYSGETTIQNIRKGQVKNPYAKDSCGGYLGEGPYLDSEFVPLRNKWRNLLQRGTGARAKYGIKYGGGDYENNFLDNSGICDEWMCFNLFAFWYCSNTIELNPEVNYEINKDVLYSLYCKYTNYNRYYSPNTCILIPEEINKIITKKYADNIIPPNIISLVSELADKYKSMNAISDFAYTCIKSIICRDSRFMIPNIDFSYLSRVNILKNHV